MNNYLVAIELMQKMSEASGEKLDNFNKRDYPAAFEQIYQSFLPAFDAIEELYLTVAEPEAMLANMAAAYTDTAVEASGKLPRRKVEQDIMNRNLYLAVFVYPAILHYKGQSSQPLSEALQKAWKEAFPKSNVTAAEMEMIQKGFTRKFCYITTAACEFLGMDDHCYELDLLRSYRDTYLEQLSNGEDLIDRYYDLAPSIVKHIDERPDRSEIYHTTWDRYILPCIRLIEAGDNAQCEQLYEQMVLDLKDKYFFSDF